MHQIQKIFSIQHWPNGGKTSEKLFVMKTQELFKISAEKYIKKFWMKKKEKTKIITCV